MKLSVVGLGHVGQAIGFATVSRGIVEELVLVGRTIESGRGDALDLRHASCFSRGVDVRSGTVDDTTGSNVVVFAASAYSAKDATDRRLAAAPNAALVRELMPRLAEKSPNAIFIIVTNPVDALTWIALEATKLPSRQIIGTGTLLDTVRLRAAISQNSGVDPKDLRVYILGEHGDSQLAVLSSASVGGAPLELPVETLHSLAEEARMVGYQIAQAKGYTSHGVALATLMIIEAVLSDSRSVLPVSTKLIDYHGVSDTCLSVPAIIGRKGVMRTLLIQMDDTEKHRFRDSAKVIRSLCESIG